MVDCAKIYKGLKRVHNEDFYLLSGSANDIRNIIIEQKRKTDDLI